MQSGSHAAYVAITRPPEDVERELTNLGLDVSKLEESDLLEVEDWYSATLGLESPGKGETIEQVEGRTAARVRSLKVADLSVSFLKELKRGSADWPTGSLVVHESQSAILRFNEEKPFLEFFESRAIPHQRKMRRVLLSGVIRGIHSESFYKRMESMSDGIIDVRVMEHEGETKNFLRIRAIRGQSHDAQWHQVRIENGEAILTSESGVNPFDREMETSR